MNVQTSVTFRFADIEVREPELRVIRSGEPLSIEPKAFRVLIYLLRHAGRLVPKEELLTAVWGETAVTDNSLTRAIALLRRLLDDDPHQPRFIETVSTVGYRFICPVENAAEAAVADQPAPLDQTKAVGAKPPEKTILSRRAVRIALVATGLVLATAAGLLWFALRPLPSLRVASYTQITNDGRMKFIVGTDGNSLYLNLYGPNGYGVVPVTGGQVVPFSLDLPTSKSSPTDSPVILGVSPDGSELLVSNNPDSSPERSLWVVDIHGGGARFLTKGFMPIWSPDGKTVLFVNFPGDLYTVPSGGGEPRHLLAPPAGKAPVAWTLAWSPDGTRIQVGLASRDRNSRYWEISADGKNPHEILPNWHASDPRAFMGVGHWTPDGDFFLFHAGTSGSQRNITTAQQVWALDERRHWLHRANPEPFQLTAGGTMWDGTVISKDGKTLYSVGITLRGELVRYDAKAKALVPYLGGISAGDVDFSPDGKYLLYVTYPEGVMWRANRDGSGLQQLVGPPHRPFFLAFSPDGTQILFCEPSPGGRGGIYTVSSQGGTPKRLLGGENNTTVFDPAWSPDGKKIVFDQRTDPEPPKSRILELDTGRITDLTPCPRSCFGSRWSPDGRYILALAFDHHDLMLLDLQTKKWSLFNLNGGNLNYHRWSHDGRFIYFQDLDATGGAFRSKSRVPGIFRIPVNGGKAEKVVDLKDFRGAGPAGNWSGLDPDDAPLLLREAGTYDVFALALERK